MRRPLLGKQLFAGHLVGSQPMKRKKELIRMMINNYWTRLSKVCFHIPFPGINVLYDLFPAS